MINKISKFFTIGCFFSLLAIPAIAADFDPNFIISDTDILAKDSMNLADIQQFLSNQPGTLSTYTCISEGKDKEGNQINVRQITAAEAYNEVSQRWGISPKFLLALTQREQSLITMTNPTQKRYDWATGYAICDNCSMDDPALQRWKGFYKQINSAAAQFEYYLNNPQEFSYQAGKTSIIDDTTVTPVNIGTAALYNYTPHLRGNKNFFNIWTSWFGPTSAEEVAEKEYPYPDGSLVKTADSPDVWYIQYHTRRLIKSKIALITRFDESKILLISKTDLDIYPTGWPIQLANYSLVRSPSKQIFLIVDDEKRPILSSEVFKAIGWNPEEVEDASEADLQNFFLGEPISEKSIYPQGVLAQDKTSGGIYFVKDGMKYAIWSKEVMQINYPGKTLIKLFTKELANYTTGDPVRLKDGTLVKANEYPEIYVISNGQRRWIPDEDTFIGLGYQWTNVISIPYKALDLHPLGEMLTLKKK
ncbi:MAG: hypothetical protein WC310_01670 [Patescibacteria group bacterium]|jgi:hypothetical protein